MRSSSSMPRSEIRLDDRRLVEHLLGRALRDLASVVERDDSVGQAAEEADLVVHEAERGAPVVNLSKDGREIEDPSPPRPRAGPPRGGGPAAPKRAQAQARPLFLPLEALAAERRRAGG